MWTEKAIADTTDLSAFFSDSKNGSGQQMRVTSLTCNTDGTIAVVPNMDTYSSAAKINQGRVSLTAASATEVRAHLVLLYFDTNQVKDIAIAVSNTGAVPASDIVIDGAAYDGATKVARFTLNPSSGKYVTLLSVGTPRKYNGAGVLIDIVDKNGNSVAKEVSDDSVYVAGSSTNGRTRKTFEVTANSTAANQTYYIKTTTFSNVALYFPQLKIPAAGDPNVYAAVGRNRRVGYQWANDDYSWSEVKHTCDQWVTVVSTGDGCQNRDYTYGGNYEAKADGYPKSNTTTRVGSNGDGSGSYVNAKYDLGAYYVIDSMPAAQNPGKYNKEVYNSVMTEIVINDQVFPVKVVRPCIPSGDLAKLDQGDPNNEVALQSKYCNPGGSSGWPNDLTYRYTCMRAWLLGVAKSDSYSTTNGNACGFNPGNNNSSNNQPINYDTLGPNWNKPLLDQTVTSGPLAGARIRVLLTDARFNGDNAHLGIESTYRDNDGIANEQWGYALVVDT